MANRRLEKIGRVIMESVSATINQRLNDPRITGLISVQDVDVAPDLKTATVSLSILAADDKAKDLTFKGIQSGAGVIQYHLGRALASRFCPRLRFELDTKTQKTIQTLRLIEQVAQEYTHTDEPDDNDSDPSDADDGIDGTDSTAGL